MSPHHLPNDCWLVRLIVVCCYSFPNLRVCIYVEPILLKNAGWSLLLLLMVVVEVVVAAAARVVITVVSSLVSNVIVVFSAGDVDGGCH